MSILLALTAAAAALPPVPAGREASIPFFNSLSSPDWRVDGDRGVYVRGAGRQWYYARFMGNCPRARNALALGFRTGPSSSLDKFSTIYAEGSVCPLVSLVESDAPPKSRKR